MKIALLGYGKMGKEIEKIAVSRGHEIVLKINVDNAKDLTVENLKKADAAIEFSTPETAYSNIQKCFEANVPVVVGTTGWTDHLNEVTKQCLEKNQSLFFSSNYSIGVNLFFKVNEYLAKLMNTHSEYNVELEEIHHIHKLDAPSGTAITLANHIIEQIDEKKNWINATTENKNEVGIISKRLGEVPGTHTVTYRSEVDEINITHFAHNRKGFAMGAVMAAEWMKGKKGVFGMNDMLGYE